LSVSNPPPQAGRAYRARQGPRHSRSPLRSHVALRLGRAACVDGQRRAEQQRAQRHGADRAASRWLRAARGRQPSRRRPRGADGGAAARGAAAGQARLPAQPGALRERHAGRRCPGGPCALCGGQQDQRRRRPDAERVAGACGARCKRRGPARCAAAARERQTLGSAHAFRRKCTPCALLTLPTPITASAPRRST